jgi:hypothetical protein
VKRHYQAYAKILSNVIKEAKRMYCNKKIENSSNKCKMTWDIIKQLSNKQHLDPDIQELMVEGKNLKRSARYSRCF